MTKVAMLCPKCSERQQEPTDVHLVWEHRERDTEGNIGEIVSQDFLCRACGFVWTEPV